MQVQYISLGAGASRMILDAPLFVPDPPSFSKVSFFLTVHDRQDMYQSVMYIPAAKILHMLLQI